MKKEHSNSIEEAIILSAHAMRGGAMKVLLRNVLLNDGFTLQQVEVMLRWAVQLNLRLKEQESE
jgi:hypothetical protein